MLLSILQEYPIWEASSGNIPYLKLVMEVWDWLQRSPFGMSSQLLMAKLSLEYFLGKLFIKNIQSKSYTFIVNYLYIPSSWIPKSVAQYYRICKCAWIDFENIIGRKGLNKLASYFQLYQVENSFNISLIDSLIGCPP